MASKEPPIKTIGLHEQRMWMNGLHPNFACRIIKRAGGSVLICRGEIKPTPMHGSYRVRVEYAIPGRPKVWVESPALLRRDPNENIPHTYADDRPCLFKEDFRSDMQIARTIVPWLSMWLVFYESWRVTGEWQGEGLHPTHRDIRHETET